MSSSLWYAMVETVDDQYFGGSKQSDDHYDRMLKAEKRLNELPREEFVNLLQEALEERYGLIPKTD